MLGTITKHEIDATQEAILAPLVHFPNFRDFCSSITRNYEFLSTAGHNISELTRIDNFLASVQAWSQFDTYISTWRANTPLGQRTLASLQQHLLDQYGDMPPESSTRGGNAFSTKGKGRGKGKGKGKTDKGKGRGLGQKRTRVLCKKLRYAGEPDKQHAVNPTSTTPNGNASVEPAYKSWI